MSEQIPSLAELPEEVRHVLMRLQQPGQLDGCVESLAFYLRSTCDSPQAFVPLLLPALAAVLDRVDFTNWSFADFRGTQAARSAQFCRVCVI